MSPEDTLHAPSNAIKPAQYLERYEEVFAPIRLKVSAVLELGIHKGGSLQMWSDYFPGATIAGLDVKAVPVEETDRIRIYRGAQQDIELLDRIAAECAPQGFDIIIDDCAHMGLLAKVSFWHLFDKHLKPGGIYVIEDWGTGYWDKWPDGRFFDPRPDRKRTFWRQPSPRTEFPSHLIGMPGFIKQLVDESAIDDITMRDCSRSTYRSPHERIKRLEISHGQVFVRKA